MQTSRLLTGCAVEALDEQHARAAGLLLGGCRLAVEATSVTVVEGALRRGDSVVTGNREHLESLAEGVSARLVVIDV